MQFSFADWIGSIGVTLLLVAFLLNLLDEIRQDSLLYILLNTIGALLACLASIWISYIPFIILEGVWTIVSAIALINYYRKNQAK